MTRGDAKKLWPLIKAWGDEKALQWLTYDGVWEDVEKVEDMGFDDDPDHYRIKAKESEVQS